MSRYELARTPRVTGGAGARETIGALAAEAGSRVLVVVDVGLIASRFFGEILHSLDQSKLSVEIFSDFTSDPSTATADRAAGIARDIRASTVVSVGGGSGLDLGKAVAAIATGDCPALDYELCKQDLPAARLRSICVPTTAGTGSEMTRTSVLTRPDKAKTWLWGDAIKPDHVVLDAELTVSLPSHLTAATGIDALVHAVEAATNRNANPSNTVYAHEAIRLVARHLATAVADGTNIVAREEMQRAAALAGLAIDNGGTAIAHAVGHAIASLRPIHHGRAVGAAMLATNAWNVEEDDGAFAACSAAMGGETTGPGFVDAFEQLLRAVPVNVDLRTDLAGISAEMLAHQIARQENDAMRLSNRRAPTQADLLAIAQRVLTQA